MPHPSKKDEPTLEGRGFLQRIRELIEDRTGIRLEADRDQRLLEAFEASAAECGLAARELLEALSLSREDEGRLLQPLIRRVVTRETYFFRDPGQLDAVRDRIIPERAARRRAAGLRLWSAGCSTGEEAYTLLFLLHETLGPEAGKAGMVFATDLDVESLRVAREALYGEHSLREIAPEARRRYFRPEKGGMWRVRDPYRHGIHFRPHNLVRDPLPDPRAGLGGMDLILCRNVLQYFRPATVRKVVGRLYQALAPGGYLLVGHAEYDLRIFGAFESRSAPGTILYRRPDREDGARQDGRQAADPKGAADPRQGERGRRLSAALRRLQAHRGISSCRMGRIQANLGKGAEAVARLQEALGEDPLDVESRYLLALLEGNAGRSSASAAHLRKVLLLQPDHLPALFSMARLLEEQERRAEAAPLLARLRDELRGRGNHEKIPFGDGLTVGEMMEALGREGDS